MLTISIHLRRWQSAQHISTQASAIHVTSNGKRPSDQDQNSELLSSSVRSKKLRAQRFVSSHTRCKEQTSHDTPSRMAKLRRWHRWLEVLLKSTSRYFSGHEASPLEVGKRIIQFRGRDVVEVAFGFSFVSPYAAVAPPLVHHIVTGGLGAPNCCFQRAVDGRWKGQDACSIRSDAVRGLLVSSFHVVLLVINLRTIVSLRDSPDAC